MVTVHQQSGGPYQAFIEEELPRIYEEVRCHDREATAEILRRWNSAFFTCPTESGACGQQILDVGCGPGSFTRHHLLPECPPSIRRLVAVDNSRPMVDYAKRKHSHPKIEHRMLDIAKEDEVSQFIADEGRFQRVYSFLVLHWIEDKKAALKNIERLMTHRGECLVIFNPHPGPLQLCKAMLDSGQWATYSDILKRSVPDYPDSDDPAFLRGYLADVVKSTGLAPLSCELVRVRSPSATIDEAVRLFLPIIPIFSLLTAEGKEDLAEFAKKFMEQGRYSNYSPTGTTNELRFVFHGYKP